jgi:ATP-dependent helicase HrpB
MVVIVLNSGAGKTTAVPLALMRDAAWMRNEGGVLLVLEPRRIAARSAAVRMAAAIGEQVGQTVGYRVRQESRVSARSRIVCVTEGMLLRQLQNDPLLEGVAGICFDEFHERSTDGDLCLALCREAQLQALPDLRLLIMSATLGDGLVDQLSSLLNNCPTLLSEGRSFPVTISYEGTLPLAGVIALRRRELAVNVAAAVLKVLARNDDGDVLVFLPGEGEIHATAQVLTDKLTAVRLLPLASTHASRPSEDIGVSAWLHDTRQ